VRVQLSAEAIRTLREIPGFAVFAHGKMKQDADFWRRESSGIGILSAAAAGIVAIGGGEDDEL